MIAVARTPRRFFCSAWLALATAAFLLGLLSLIMSVAWPRTFRLLRRVSTHPIGVSTQAVTLGLQDFAVIAGFDFDNNPGAYDHNAGVTWWFQSHHRRYWADVPTPLERFGFVFQSTRGVSGRMTRIGLPCWLLMAAGGGWLLRQFAPRWRARKTQQAVGVVDAADVQAREPL